MNTYKNYLASYILNLLSSLYIPSPLVSSSILSWPKLQQFGGTLGLEERHKIGSISEMTCWLAAVVEDSCVISGKFVQSPLGWEISGKLVGRASTYVVNVSTDYPAILQFNIIGLGSLGLSMMSCPGVSWKISYCLERPFFILLIIM